jgi:hypothetical protein
MKQKAEDIATLEDGGFYWVRFSPKDELEVAKFRKDQNRFRFTNGSTCEPERMHEINYTKITPSL